jgi:2-deoxy-D-gluconate 3-dehydrogenase
VNPFDLTGRVALVTGGNSGLGLAMARGLRDAGARVAIGARRRERNAQALAELGGSCKAYELDVTDEESVARTVAQVVEELGGLDVLVNNAGTVNRASVLEMTRDQWDTVMSVNLTGAFFCTKHAARVMVQHGRGKIINISSGYGLLAPSKGMQIAYTASKHGLIGLTRVNAIELAPRNVQVNASLPAWCETEITADLRGTPLARAVAARSPLGRWGRADEVAGPCVFLASSASDYVTGACLAVDGGYSVSDGLDRG